MTVIFHNVFNFRYKRSATEAVGFLITYFVLCVATLFACALVEKFIFQGHSHYFLMPGASWVKLFIVGSLAMAMISQRRLWSDWTSVVLVAYLLISSVYALIMPFVGLAYLSTQDVLRSKSRVWIAGVVLVYITAALSMIFFGRQIGAVYNYYQTRASGVLLETKVLNFSETAHEKQGRLVKIKIEWPNKTDGLNIQPVEIWEKWPKNAKVYKAGDSIKVYYLARARRGAQQRFGLFTVHKLLS